MSEKHAIGSVVFNPAPGAAAPFTSMNTQTLMMSCETVVSIPALQRRITELEAQLEAALAKPDWIRVEDALPEPGVPVIAYVPHYGGQTNSRRIRAQYAAKHSLEQHADAEGGDYDEASDTYYCEPGWYEDNEYEEIHWRVSDEVTHWQSLPQPPEGIK